MMLSYYYLVDIKFGISRLELLYVKEPGPFDGFLG
jgi:hypothetical protein